MKTPTAYKWRSGIDHFRKAGVPDLYTQENEKDPMIRLKLFDPCGRYTLYVLEIGVSGFNGRPTIFGYVRSPLGPDCDELGYQDLEELAGVRNRLGLGLEQDLGFRPIKLCSVQTGANA